MSDADGRMIPFVDDDQGEGIKDFFEEKYREMNQETFNRQLADFEAKADAKRIREALKKSESDGEVIDEILKRVERIENRLTHIFGTHVLIDGKWKAII